MQADVGVHHGKSIMWERDYQDVTQPAASQLGVVSLVNRSFDTFLNNDQSQSTIDVLQSNDGLVYVSKSGPWPQESVTTIYVNDIQALPTQYQAFPEIGVISFRRRLGARDVVSLEVEQPSSFRVGIRMTNATMYAGMLDSFAYMYGSTIFSQGSKPAQPPTATNLFISPSPVFPNGPINANYTFYSPTGAEEDLSQTQITWFCNNAPIPSLQNERSISSSSTQPISTGQQWFFTVRPSDGTLFGPLSTSQVITIAPTIPTASNVTLTSSNVDSTVFTTQDTIMVNFVYQDSDGNPPSGVVYAWYVNGFVEKSGADNTLSPADKTAAGTAVLQVGGLVYVQVTPSDGAVQGPTAQSPTVAITASPPSVTGVTISPTAPFSSNSLALTYTFADVDGYPDSSTIAWYLNGQVQTQLAGLTTISSSLLAPAQSWYAMVTPVASGVSGTAAQSNTVTVQF
jgi:hypothetical protein